MHTASLASATTTTTQGESIGPAVVLAAKNTEDALVRWRRGRRDPTQCPILENDNNYTDWIIKITCQLNSEECKQLINLSFKETKVIGDADNDLQYSIFK